MLYIYFYILHNIKMKNKMFNGNQLVFALCMCKHNSFKSKLYNTILICIASQFTILPVLSQAHILILIKQPL